MGGILAKIIQHKRREVEQAIRDRPLRDLMQAADAASPTRDFLTALRTGDRVRLIAEVKKASPSKGVLRHDFDPVAIARGYARGGASCISVLTDREFFRGDLEYLRTVRQAVDLPLLRKDFIVHPYQVFEARVAGADAILLIAECLTRQEMRGLYSLARDLGMAVLIELYDAANLDNVLHTGTELIGINNRDLETFEVDLHHTIRLRNLIPAETIVVSESGIHSRDDVRLLEENGIQAMLVGEALVRQPDVETAVRRLLGTAPVA